LIHPFLLVLLLQALVLVLVLVVVLVLLGFLGVEGCWHQGSQASL